MAALLIYPGTKGEPVALQDVLREAHDAFRERRATQIELRKKRRVPLDDNTDWARVTEAVASTSVALSVRDSAKIAKLGREIADLTEGNTLEEIGPYEPDPVVDGITITMQVVADSDRRMWSAETQAHWARASDARLAGDMVAAQVAMNAIDAVAAKVVCAVVVDIKGVDGLKPTVAESIPGLVLANLLGSLYAAAQHFLDLPVGKAVRCGLPPLSI